MPLRAAIARMAMRPRSAPSEWIVPVATAASTPPSSAAGTIPRASSAKRQVPKAAFHVSCDGVGCASTHVQADVDAKRVRLMSDDRGGGYHADVGHICQTDLAASRGVDQ